MKGRLIPAVAAGAGLATLLLFGAPALADASETATAAPEVSYTRATRFDTTDVKLPELINRMPAAQSKPLYYEVPNQFDVFEEAERNDLERDPLAERGASRMMGPALIQSFPGPSSDDNQFLFGSRPEPPDTNGDVGRDFVVSYINVNWSVYDKTSGARVAGPFAGNSLWAGFGGKCENDNQGDSIVLYDHLADRWVFSQLTVPGSDGIQCFAVTQGSDPLGPYNRYEFTVSPGEFNDYPKLGLWSDGGGQSAYHYTGRQFRLPFLTPFLGIDAGAFERDAMLAGQPAGYIHFRFPGISGVDGIMPPHLDGGPAAPAGSCGLYGVADAPNRYRFWEFCPNFNAPGASTFGEVAAVTTAAFDNGLGDVPLPGGDNVDTLAHFTHYRFSHRNLAEQGHYATISHTVDVGGDRAGIRWAILDVNNYNNVAIVDTGTYGPNDGRERWMGSTTLDKVGNLGLGYTRAGSGAFPSVYVTGRETTDPAGTLQAETSCVEGTGSQTGGGGRWGDYSATSIDPVDECTFWSFQEYVETTGNRQWNTRVCSFSFPSCEGGVGPTYTLLDTNPGTAGALNEWTTQNGTPNRGNLIYFSLSGGSSTVSIGPCSNVTMNLANARPIAFSVADGAGTGTASRTLPPQIAGRTILFQALDLGNCSTSNVTSTTF